MISWLLPYHLGYVLSFLWSGGLHNLLPDLFPLLHLKTYIRLYRLSCMLFLSFFFWMSVISKLYLKYHILWPSLFFFLTLFIFCIYLFSFYPLPFNISCTSPVGNTGLFQAYPFFPPGPAFTPAFKMFLKRFREPVGYLFLFVVF